MSVSTQHAVGLSPARVDVVPKFFATDLIVTPESNPVYTPAMLADLLVSIREHTQLVPGWVAPSPTWRKPSGSASKATAAWPWQGLLGLPFWAFDLGRFVPEAERIKLTFQHNHSRRSMGREEIVTLASWATSS